MVALGGVAGWGGVSGPHILSQVRGVGGVGGGQGPWGLWAIGERNAQPTEARTGPGRACEWGPCFPHDVHTPLPHEHSREILERLGDARHPEATDLLFHLVEKLQPFRKAPGGTWPDPDLPRAGWGSMGPRDKCGITRREEPTSCTSSNPLCCVALGHLVSHSTGHLYLHL